MSPKLATGGAGITRLSNRTISYNNTWLCVREGSEVEVGQNVLTFNGLHSV